MHRHLISALMVLLLLGGCTTLRETQPAQTAREQLLLSTAADQASARIAPNVSAGSSIYVDTTNFNAGEDYGGNYAINAIKASLLKKGYDLAASADKADTICEVSSGALSIDETTHLFGLPSGDVPIPLAGTLSTPELAIYKAKNRTGTAKFLLTFYDAKTGALQDANGPLYGFSHYDKWSLLGYGKTESNLLPAEAKKRGKSD